MLKRLLELRQISQTAEELLLVIVTTDLPTSGERPAAWRNLLHRVTAQTGEPPLRTRILTWPEEARTPNTKSQQRSARDATQLDELFGLVARHPLLTCAQLASLLGTSAARVAVLESKLVERGWLLRIGASGLTGGAGEREGAFWRLGLVELTRSGSREASRRLLLPAQQAARHHGMLGSSARGHRRVLRHLAHTIGANAVFTRLALAARDVTGHGGDDTLLEWRSAAACARGRCRPDGYGCYRRGVARFGFFLEYDRGTERAREYATKLEAYYRYRDSGSAARDYIGFPSVLVVTTRARAEEQIAYQAFLASERHSSALPLLLTTTRHIEVHAEGILGPIWRAPGPLGGIVLRRGYWLPGGHPSGLLRSLRDGPPANTSVVTASSWSAKGAR